MSGESLGYSVSLYRLLHFVALTYISVQGVNRTYTLFLLYCTHPHSALIFSQRWFLSLCNVTSKCVCHLDSPEPEEYGSLLRKMAVLLQALQNLLSKPSGYVYTAIRGSDCSLCRHTWASRNLGSSGTGSSEDSVTWTSAWVAQAHPKPWVITQVASPCWSLYCHGFIALVLEQAILKLVWVCLHVLQSPCNCSRDIPSEDPWSQ